jgi:serine/threonine-protein kinase
VTQDDEARSAAAARSAALERACDFGGAARASLEARDPRRAALLASLAGDDELAARAVAEAGATLSREEAMRCAAELSSRGFGKPAGALYTAIGEHLAAAQAFAITDDAVSAARSYDRAGKPAEGARALEAALKTRPAAGALRLELGRLLARHGRVEAAAKALQQIAIDSPDHARSLPLLCRCLRELSLEEAAHAVELEMKQLGVADEEPERGDEIEPASRASPALFGRYEIVREVAVTPHARVLEAIDRLGGGRVAVKLLAGLDGGAGRDALLRFEREARALSQLRHPNVVPLVAYHPEGPAMVLPWMGGGTLADRLRAEEIAPARAVEIASAVLGALGEAHRLGILHRDVKPSNVLFDEFGTARLADFGAAHLGDLSITATAGAIGTFAYMSPEQRLGRPATLASDLYATGVMLGELLTGDPVAPAVGEHLAVPLETFDDELGDAHDAIVAALVQEDPKRRPPDAFAARRLLGSIKWPERTSPRPPRASASAPPRASERPTGDDRLGPSLDVGDGRDTTGRVHDAWLARDVLVVALDEAEAARVRAFARAGHPSLPTVLRVDPGASAAWIGLPRGRALADAPRGLSPGQVARLREAIEALHAASGAHGRIDAEHLYEHDGDVTLAFPRGPVADGDLAAADRAALDALEPG